MLRQVSGPRKAEMDHLEVFAEACHPLSPMCVSRRSCLIAWPDDLVRPVPHFLGECCSESSDHLLDVLVHNSQRLIGPEVSSRVGEVVILEE